MQMIATSFAIFALSFSALAQQVERSLHYTATSAPQDMQEIATVIRCVTDIPQATVDPSENLLSLRGTAAQIALAEWMFPNLDKSVSETTPQDQNGAKLEYQASDSADDIVRLFYLTNPKIPQGFQELATAVRAMADLRRMFTYNKLRAIAIRGTAEQLKTAEFLFSQMDKPEVVRGVSRAVQSSASSEFRLSEGPDNLVRVFYVPNTKTVRDFQEIATGVRSIVDLRRMFTYNAARAIAVRGTAEQLGLAEWMLSQLDAAVESRPNPASTHEYRLSSPRDPIVRIFYLAHATTPQRVQQTADEIRRQANARYVFTYPSVDAISIRAIPDKVALAGRLIQDLDK